MEITGKAKPFYKSECKFFFIILENVLLLLKDMRPVNVQNDLFFMNIYSGDFKPKIKMVHSDSSC